MIINFGRDHQYSALGHTDAALNQISANLYKKSEWHNKLLQTHRQARKHGCFCLLRSEPTKVETNACFFNVRPRYPTKHSCILFSYNRSLETASSCYSLPLKRFACALAYSLQTQRQSGDDGTWVKCSARDQKAVSEWSLSLYMYMRMTLLCWVLSVNKHRSASAANVRYLLLPEHLSPVVVAD